MRNFVVMHIGGEPWTLAGLLVVASAVGFVIWVGFVIILAPRWGRVRALSASEAAQVAINAAETGYVDRLVPIRGPARGAEAKIEYSIGTLREAWQTRDYVRFVGLPAMSLWFVAVFECLAFSGYIGGGSNFWLLVGVPNIILTPMAVVPPFMMWAAVYTKLE